MNLFKSSLKPRSVFYSRKSQEVICGNFQILQWSDDDARRRLLKGGSKRDIRTRAVRDRNQVRGIGYGTPINLQDRFIKGDSKRGIDRQSNSLIHNGKRRNRSKDGTGADNLREGTFNLVLKGGDSKANKLIGVKAGKERRRGRRGLKGRTRGKSPRCGRVDSITLGLSNNRPANGNATLESND